MQGILQELILYPDLVFQNFDLKIHFWANLDRKSKSCLFCLISTFVFWISNPKYILGKFGIRKLNLFVLPENSPTQHLEDADSYSEISILKFQTYI